MNKPKDKAAYAGFRATSARLGSDAMLVQAAGGNTSMKADGVLWVKASGTWLSNANEQDIMVPLHLDGLKSALSDRSLIESEISEYVIGKSNARASVEAPFHAAFDAKYVLHVHSISTLAFAALANASVELEKCLEGVDWSFIPYIKPGLPLTYAMMDSGALDHEVVVLGNHGLIVAHDDINYAEGLLRGVHNELLAAMASHDNGTFVAKKSIDAGPKYRYCTVPGCDKLALEPAWQKIVTTGAIAPDFVVFLGSTLPVLDAGPALNEQLLQLAQQPLPLGSAVIIRGEGVLIRDDAMKGTEELLQGLCAVLSALEAAGWPDIRYFSTEEEQELLNWDAEKYRQLMNAGSENG